MPLDYLPVAACTIEAAFPLRGDALPADHGAALFDALCRQPELGAWLMATDAVAIAPVHGRADGSGGLTLTDESLLLMRLAANELPRVLRLAGASLPVKGHALEVGEPHVRLPRPAATLHAGLVVFDAVHSPPGDSHAAAEGSAQAAFSAAVRASLSALEISGQPVIGAAGSLQLPGRSVPGFAVQIRDLAPEDSIHLLEAGLGDHHKRCCGVFAPA